MIIKTPQNCLIIETNYGTINLGGEQPPRQLGENERQLKTFFADDKFFDKTVAAAPTCTSANLVVTKIYRMLRIEAEMDDAMLRSKPFLEALIGVLPENEAFTARNLQKAIQKSQV